MKKLFLLSVLMLLPLLASADAVEINGIYYNLIGKAKVAEVVHSDSYSGDIAIPESVNYEGVTYKITSIGKEAFSRLNNITSVSIPVGVTEIGEKAFAFSKNIKTIVLSNTVTSIGNYAFRDCGIETIDLPNSIQSIGHHAFAECKNLKYIELPNNNPYYDYGVFGDCVNLVEAKIPDGKLAIEQAMFYGCTSLKSIEIPNSVESIGYGAFQYCTGLSKLDIPDGVNEIKSEAFSGCKKIDTITLGVGVSKIGADAFNGCEGLRDVICYAVNPPSIDKTAFDNSYPEYITLHVRKNSIELYKTSADWSIFKEIIKIQMPEHTLNYVVDGEVYKTYTIEEGDKIIPEPAPTKDGYTFSGWSEIPEEMPARDVTVTGTFTRILLGQCTVPTIKIENGEIVFACETEDVEYHYTISHQDVKAGAGNNVKLTNKYIISVYASKDGYTDSEVAKAEIVYNGGSNGDMNGDGVVNVADIVKITNLIMNK